METRNGISLEIAGNKHIKYPRKKGIVFLVEKIDREKNYLETRDT